MARNPELRRRDLLAAQDPNTPPDELRVLLNRRDRHVHQALAANPSTPEDVLVRVGARYPKELLANPIWDLWLAVEPDLLRRLPLSTAVGIGRCRETPPGLLRALVPNRSISVPLRCAVAGNPACPTEMMPGFLRHAREVRAALAGNRRCPPNLLARLADDPSSGVRAEAGGNRLCPQRALQRLARDASLGVRASVAGNPRLPVESGVRLAESEHLPILQCISQNRGLPLTVQEYARNRLSKRIAARRKRYELLRQGLSR